MGTGRGGVLHTSGKANDVSPLPLWTTVRRLTNVVAGMTKTLPGTGVPLHRAVPLAVQIANDPPEAARWPALSSGSPSLPSSAKSHHLGLPPGNGRGENPWGGRDRGGRTTWSAPGQLARR